MQTPPADWFLAADRGYKPPVRSKRTAAIEPPAAALPSYQDILTEFERRTASVPPLQLPAAAAPPSDSAAAALFDEFHKRTGQKL